MIKRRIKVVAFAGLTVGLLVLGVGVWRCLAPTTDAGRDRLMLREWQLFSKFSDLERGGYDDFFRPFHISDWMLKRYWAQRDALLRSGYLTKISVTAPPPNSSEWDLVSRLYAAEAKTGIHFARYNWQSGSLTITCRATEAERLGKAINEEIKVHAPQNY